MEQDIIGAGISPHPLVEIAKRSSKNLVGISDLVEGSEVTVLAQIDTIKIIRTKSKGEQMAFLSVTDTKKKLDITLFPEVYRKYRQILTEKTIYYFTGKIQERDQRLQMILHQLEPALTEKFWIKLQNHDYDKEVSAILADYPGNIPVVLHYAESKETLQSSRHFVAKSSELEEKLANYALKTLFR